MFRKIIAVYFKNHTQVAVHLMITVQKIPTQLMIWRWPSQNTFRMWTVLYWTQSLRTQFDVSINVWRLTGDSLNITCNFMYCNQRCIETFWSPCIYTLCGKNADLMLKQEIYSYHCALKGLAITNAIVPSSTFMQLGSVLITECVTIQLQTKLLELLQT
jgi:hypothetical protein